MADGQSMTVREALGKVIGDEHADVLRDGVRMIVGELMEAEVAQLAGAERDEHSPDRVRSATGTASASGTRGSGRSSWRSRGCAPGRTSRAFWSRGAAPSRRWSRSSRRPTSTACRRARSTGWWSSSGSCSMSKSQVSRLCAGLDEQVAAFRERPLEGRYPYLWLDAKIERVREPGGVRQKAW